MTSPSREAAAFATEAGFSGDELNKYEWLKLGRRTCSSGAAHAAVARSPSQIAPIYADLTNMTTIRWTSAWRLVGVKSIAAAEARVQQNI